MNIVIFIIVHYYSTLLYIYIYIYIYILLYIIHIIIVIYKCNVIDNK